MPAHSDSDGASPLKRAKWERFALLVAAGEVSAAEAYRREVARAGATDKTIHEESCKLAANPKVRPRIDYLRAKLAEKAGKKFDLDKDKWLAELTDIVAKAKDKGDFSAATGALDKIGRACAYYEPERHKLEIEVVIGGNSEGQN